MNRYAVAAAVFAVVAGAGVNSNFLGGATIAGLATILFGMLAAAETIATAIRQK